MLTVGLTGPWTFSAGAKLSGSGTALFLVWNKCDIGLWGLDFYWWFMLFSWGTCASPIYQIGKWWVDATLKNILRFNVIFWKSSQVCFQHSECGKSESRHSNDNIALLVLLNIQGTRIRDILETIKFKLCTSLFCPKGLEMFKCWIIDIQMVKHLELWVDYDRWSVTKSD